MVASRSPEWMRQALMGLALSSLLSLVLGCTESNARGSNTFGEDGAGEDSEGSSGEESGSSEVDSESAADEERCPLGSESCPCTMGGACDEGLECVEGVCTAPGDTDESEPSTETESETTESSESESGGVCTESVVFELDAIDADDFVGFEVVESSIGEGMVLAWDEDTDNAYALYNFDIPCTDQWHVWVRGHDVETFDSFFVAVDGEPEPPPVFELDCTGMPAQSAYVWRELNYRDAEAPPCETIDPWVQSWDEGFHSLLLLHRESLALSKLYVTNTDVPPE